MIFGPGIAPATSPPLSRGKSRCAFSFQAQQQGQLGFGNLSASIRVIPPSMIAPPPATISLILQGDFTPSLIREAEGGIEPGDAPAADCQWGTGVRQKCGCGREVCPRRCSSTSAWPAAARRCDSGGTTPAPWTPTRVVCAFRFACVVPCRLGQCRGQRGRVPDRNVSPCQFHLRPIVHGKARCNVEPVR